MPTYKKDFKSLKLPDPELDFATGFTTALVVVAGLLKLAGVIV